MVNRDLIAAKLSELALRIDRVRRHAKQTSAELGADPDSLDLVAFNLMLCVQICADLQSHIIADASWPSARTLAEGFTDELHDGLERQREIAALRLVRTDSDQTRMSSGPVYISSLPSVVIAVASSAWAQASHMSLTR